jgi:uncharacterized protein YcbK (DUF882 family)
MRYFTLDEFECSCCQENEMKEEFLERLDEARALSSVPFVITSGYRCPEHNKAIGGVTGSSHTKGWAADIACPSSRHRWNIISSLIAAGFDRIGVSDGFVHVDYDPDKLVDLIWTY